MATPPARCWLLPSKIALCMWKTVVQESTRYIARGFQPKDKEAVFWNPIMEKKDLKWNKMRRWNAIKTWHINKNVMDVRWKSDERSVYRLQQRSPEPGGSQPPFGNGTLRSCVAHGGTEDPLTLSRAHTWSWLAALPRLASEPPHQVSLQESSPSILPNYIRQLLL